MADKTFKVGTVALVGRPNVGKSTLLNNILDQKVAAVSPRPQTTQTPVHAVYEDDRGQVFFLDTPGLFRSKSKTTDLESSIIQAMRESNLLVYVVDPTREFGHEEMIIQNLIHQSGLPYILAINKIDLQQPNFQAQYRQQLADQALTIVEISAQRKRHIKQLLEHIFEQLPSGDRNKLVDNFVTPILSHSGSEYLSELIREKIYLHTSEEVPYKTSVQNLYTEEVPDKNRLKVTADIHVSHPRYKPMLIGKAGQKIRQISQAVREELQLATNKQVVVKLRVTD